MDNFKKLPVSSPKTEIKIKESPAAKAIKKAPDEAIAKAIHDMLVKEKLK